jgi:hypothetical protein
MAKLKLERPYFYSKDGGRFGRVLSDDSKRIVYEFTRFTDGQPYVPGKRNRALDTFYQIYPDVRFLTEQEYLFEMLKHD